MQNSQEYRKINMAETRGGGGRPPFADVFAFSYLGMCVLVWELLSVCYVIACRVHRYVHRHTRKSLKKKLDQSLSVCCESIVLLLAGGNFFQKNYKKNNNTCMQEKKNYVFPILSVKAQRGGGTKGISHLRTCHI